ncbi:MAG: Rab family GTPase [Promethearchaeota archaeon]
MGRYKLKILLIGDAAVGKTTLIKRFVKDIFHKEYKMTVGCDLFMKDLYLNNGEDSITLSIWDIAGQERFQFVRQAFYKGALGALVVFDLTRYTTFSPNILKWIKDLWNFTGRVPIVLLGNKVDLTIMRSVRTKDAEMFADKVPCPYIETSAKEGQGVDDAFNELAKLAFEYWQKTNT